LANTVADLRLFIDGVHGGSQPLERKYSGANRPFRRANCALCKVDAVAIEVATQSAVAATLAAVFFGLTVGSLASGALAIWLTGPLRADGLREIRAGVGALLVLPPWLGLWASLVFVGIAMKIAGDFCLSSYRV